MPWLVLPTTDVHESFLAALAEEGRSAQPGDDMELLRDPERFQVYVEGLRALAEEDTPRLEGYVPATDLWYVDGRHYLGRLSIRHRLVPHLLEVGGHIGYDVRPSARRRGHATRMLALALPVAHGLGIDPVLVTCDYDNVASRKVIEANGGVLEDRRGVKLRYWLTTSPPGVRRTPH